MVAPTRKGPFFLSVFGLLKENTDPAVAQEELHVLNDRLFPLWADSYQDEDTTWGMQPVRELLHGDVDQLLLILMSSVGLLLLTATANATNLLLARISGRRRELAVRSSMGAPRWRILSLLLTESGILAAGGVTVGLLLAYWAMDILPTFASGYLPRLEELELSGPVLAFAGTLALASGLLFGLISALQGSNGKLEDELKTGGRTATGSRGRQRIQRILVVGQIALAVPLLTGASLLLNSFANLYQSELGVEMEGYLSVTVPLDRNRYPDPDARYAFWDQIGARMESIPNVRSMGLGTGRPPSRAGMTNNFDLEDNPTPPGASEPSVPWLFVDNEYFETLGIPHLAGRLFQPSDLDADAPPVILVDEAWANRFFPGQEVLGRRLQSGGCTTCPFTTVVGVVGTVPYQGVESSSQGAVYGPGARGWLARPILHIRATGDPALLIPRIREEIRAADPGIPLTDFSTGESLVRDSLREPRHLSAILSSFSVVALFLAVVGLYGIVAYSVHQRRGDIAVRMALGGTPREVLGMIIRQGMALVLVGLVVGSGIALAFTGVLSDLLYQVEPNDPLILVGVVLLLASVSLISCIFPGMRAVGIEPASTLQEE
jgi:predicted permease